MSKTPALEAAAFTLDEGSLVRESSGSRTVLKYTAPSKRHIDGGFEVSVYAILFDADGRFVARRSADGSRTVLANRAFWMHEFDNDKLAHARQLVYEVQYRVDYRRKLLGGELPVLPAESDGSDYWRWMSMDPRALEDRLVKLDFTLWARNGYLEITYSQIPKVSTDSMRTEAELDLLDADGNVAFTRNFGMSLNHGCANHDDTSISMDRKSLRTLKFFELRGRTECRTMARLMIDLA